MKIEEARERLQSIKHPSGIDDLLALNEDDLAALFLALLDAHEAVCCTCVILPPSGICRWCQARSTAEKLMEEM